MQRLRFDKHRKRRAIRQTNRPNILYVSYEGLLSPEGESRVVSYLAGLAKRGRSLAVVSFEEWSDLRNSVRLQRLDHRLKQLHVEWHPVGIQHRSVFAQRLFGILRGQRLIATLARKYDPDIIHARGYSAAILSLLAKPFCGNFLFDVRNFWPEERVELNQVRSGGTSYRVTKRLEKVLFAVADEVIVPTTPARQIVVERIQRVARARQRPVDVTIIPGATDLDRFRPSEPSHRLIREHRLEGKTLIGNIGAANNRYLLEEMFRFARFVKQHHPKLLFVYVTREDPERVLEPAVAAGLRRSDVLVVASEAEAIPEWLSLLRLGIFFMRPSHAAKASSSAKLGELLASGVPVITNKGVGDVERIIASTAAGIVLEGLNDANLAAAAARAGAFLSRPRQHWHQGCRAIASEHLSLEQALDTYERVYDRCARGIATANASLNSEVA